MCLAIPARVLAIGEHWAEVEVMGNKRQVNTDLLGEAAYQGDYVLVHAGYALEKVDGSTALETVDLIEEALEELEH